ncbi:MAG: cohesin domain-containing protein, partial [Bacteroidota bacterium]
MKINYILMSVLLFVSGLAYGQGNNCTFLSIDYVNAEPGDEICLPVRVSSFEAILGLQGTIEFDTTRLEYIEVSNFTLPGLIAAFFGQPEQTGQKNKVTLAWFDASLNTVDKTDGESIFDICFKVKENVSGYAPVVFSINPTSIEVTRTVDGVGLDARNDVLLQGGGVYIGQTENAPELTTASACDDSIYCPFDTSFSFSATVSGGVPPYRSQWDGPAGLTSQTYPGLELNDVSFGTYYLTVVDSIGQSLILVQNFSNSSATYKAEVSQEPCVANSGSITLDFNGKEEQYDIIWTNGSTETAINNLSPGDYGVTVTDKNTSCSQVDVFTIDDSQSDLKGQLQYECLSYNGKEYTKWSFYNNPQSDDEFQYEWTYQGATISGSSSQETLLIEKGEDYVISLQVSSDNTACEGFYESTQPDCEAVEVPVWNLRDTISTVNSLTQVLLDHTGLEDVIGLEIALNWAGDSYTFWRIDYNSVFDDRSESIFVEQETNSYFFAARFQNPLSLGTDEKIIAPSFIQSEDAFRVLIDFDFFQTKLILSDGRIIRPQLKSGSIIPKAPNDLIIKIEEESLEEGDSVCLNVTAENF